MLLPAFIDVFFRIGRIIISFLSDSEIPTGYAWMLISIF